MDSVEANFIGET
jgi:hypothetical protein